MPPKSPMITTTCKALLPVCYHNEEGLQPYPNPLPEELWPFAPHVEGPPGLEQAFLKASMPVDDRNGTRTLELSRNRGQGLDDVAGGNWSLRL